MDNQSWRYTPDDKLEGFLYSSVHKSTQLDHWFPCIDCSVRKAMGDRDFEWPELKVKTVLCRRFEANFQWSKYAYFSQVDIEPGHFLRIQADIYTSECEIQLRKSHFVRKLQVSMDLRIYFSSRPYPSSSQSLERIQGDNQHTDRLDIQANKYKRHYRTLHSSHTD